MMEGRLLAQARRKKAAIRSANQAEEARRHTEVYAAVPEIEEIDKSIRGLMASLVGVALGKESTPVASLEERSLSLQTRRMQLLKAHGYPETYLNPIFSCEKCRDTGIENGKNCSCLLALYKQEQTLELAPLLEKEPGTFETFRLDYYSVQPFENGRRSPRESMLLILNICRKYAADFGSQSENLLLSGNPGLGKTFLSAAIARVVAEKGVSVAYDTAGGLLAAFEREKFSRDEDDSADAAGRVRQLLDCDLLILDDLGTEMSTSFTQSALYSLLDGRLRQGRKTIISTNLDKDGISVRYGAQLASRLLGEYSWLEFVGRDIRALKKEGAL